MPIIGALIARGSIILVEYAPPGTNFPSIARRLAAQIPPSPDSKNSYNYENHNFNYLVEGGITYICMTDQDMKLRVPYAFLFDINNRFKAAYRDRIMTAGVGAMNDSFSRILRERMEFFSNDRNADKINKVKGEIEDAKAIMVQNIDKVLERGDRIEMLVSKTENLHSQSQSFKKKSTQLKRKMWWQNARYCGALICVIVALVAGVTLYVMWHFGLFALVHHDHPSSTTGSITTNFVPTTQSLTTQSITTGDQIYASTSSITTSAITTSAITTQGASTTSLLTTASAPSLTTAATVTSASTPSLTTAFPSSITTGASAITTASAASITSGDASVTTGGFVTTGSLSRLFRF